jgi:hypothetical protein
MALASACGSRSDLLDGDMSDLTGDAAVSSATLDGGVSTDAARVEAYGGGWDLRFDGRMRSSMR